MTELSLVDVATQIRDHLTGIERDHDIHIILAVESGSRAWGFPSTNSDYDVRFIYSRRKRDYLSVISPRDTIEIPIFHDDVLNASFDAVGWDIRKCLLLAAKSNAALLEWLCSPIKYIEDADTVDYIQDFAKDHMSFGSLSYHYYSLAKNAWNQICNNQNPSPKLYCYALRSAMSLRWMEEVRQFPPLPIKDLLYSAMAYEPMRQEVKNLIKLKSQVDEKYTIPRNELLDAYIEALLQDKPEKPSNATEEQITERADRLFRKIIR